MPDWLGDSFVNTQTAPPEVLAWRIGAALVLGGVVAGLYRFARRGQSVQANFLTTLVLLSAAIAMATQVIGDNVARAFSLVGALSVVRFRTVVKDTQDTAFVILTVVVGMAAGANNLMVAIVGLVVLGLASFLLWPSREGGPWQRVDVSIVLKVSLEEGVRERAETALGAAVTWSSLISAAATKRATQLELVYRARLRPGRSPQDLAAELGALEGVEGVELRRTD